MDLYSQGMKGPSRAAPPPPGTINRYSPVSNWNDDPFGDVFEPKPNLCQKKKPPPRPPPPKINTQIYPDLPTKPSHFVRKPTVLSSLLSRKGKTQQNPANHSNHSSNNNLCLDFNSEIDSSKMFPKCEMKSIQTGALIDLSSPPSSPTFTTRSSSDGLSVDSFGSDITSSTNHQHTVNGGNASQAESGFEDDFDLFVNTRKINREDTFDDFNNIDPFSPPPTFTKPPLMKKPIKKDYMDLLCNGKSSPQLPPAQKCPTIIRAKPARPKPPDNTAILKTTFGNALSFPAMTVNTTMPIQKVFNGFGDNFDSKPLSWDDDREDERSTPERDDRESSPPMPTIPPPPPPQIDEESSKTWFDDEPCATILQNDDTEEPYAIALYDYSTGHDEDLSFTVNTKITLLRRENEEWLYGKLRSGAEGLFPSNYVEIKVPLPNETIPTPPLLGTATVLYDFEPSQPGDLRLVTGHTVSVMYKINEEWYFGESEGQKGQFPANYVQMN